MEFARLVHSFEKLEKTSSRLALIAILAELFRSIDSPDEIAKVCYLGLIAFREKDKKPEDATIVEELIEMYEIQGKKKQ